MAAILALIHFKKLILGPVNTNSLYGGSITANKGV
jgi:hypothetical protein